MITAADLPGMQSNFNALASLKDPSSTIANATSGLLASVNDPIGAALSKTLSAINSLSVVVNTKLTSLEEDIIKSADNTGKVKLVGQTIVITLEPEDAAKLPQYQAKIQGDVNSINSTISKLKVVTSVLSTITVTAKTLKTAMDVQEVLLTVGNPVAKATMTLLKKALKILFYKDVLNEYVNILTLQAATSNQQLKDIITKFSGLSVKFVVNRAADTGITVTTNQAQKDLVNNFLGNLGIQEYTNDLGKIYTLLVEPYNTRELIGRARDKYSNLLAAETAPSFISTPDQLLEELKIILNQ